MTDAVDALGLYLQSPEGGGLLQIIYSQLITLAELLTNTIARSAIIL